MPDPIIAKKSPINVQVEAGKSYLWCSCGTAAEQPFCDGSHKNAEKIAPGFRPQRYEASETHEVHFCACKHTKNAPLCDGSHRTL